MPLYPEDLDLLARDTALPDLRTALDPDALAGVLRPHVPVTKVEATYIRYKPGMNALVAHRLENDDGVHPVYVKAHRRGDGFKVEKALHRSQTPGTAGFGRIALAETLMVAAFPNDGKLRVLCRLGEDEARLRLLERLFPDRPDWHRGDLVRLNYKPERRFVARLDVAGRPVAVLKFFTGSSFEASHTRARAFREGAALRLAPVLARSHRHRVLAYAWMPGRLMHPLLLAGSLPASGTARVGAALAALHAQTAPALPLLSRAREAEAVQAVAEAVAFVLPRLAGRARHLAARLARALALRPLAPVPVHGDFYAKQVLLPDDGPVTLIDFDGSARGDAALDTGNFVAHLERDRLRYGFSDVAEARAALCDGYRAAGGTLDEAAVDLYAAYGVMLLAPHPFRFREPDWPARTEALVARAEAHLAAAEAAGVAVPAARPHVRPLPPEATPAFAAEALDPAAMQTHLAAHWRRWGEEGTPTLTGVRLLRHKPGRRCLIAYDIETAGRARRTLLGKVRAKGLDVTTFRLMQRLHDEGFGPGSPDGICVPRPVGCLPELRMWLQEEVPGRVATDLMSGPEGVALARRMAAALRKLNRCGPRPARLHTLADEGALLRDRLQRVAAEQPALAPRLHRILDACLDRAARLVPTVFRPIHRDFYPANVLVDGDRLYLLDLDLYALGEPALDAGNFIGHLTEQSLRQTGDPKALADREEALAEAFAARRGAGAREAVHTCTTLTLARHIYISTLFPDRRALTGALVTLCEERLFGASYAEVRRVSLAGGT